jgi:hypothetical protein
LHADLAARSCKVKIFFPGSGFGLLLLNPRNLLANYYLFLKIPHYFCWYYIIYHPHYAHSSAKSRYNIFVAETVEEKIYRADPHNLLFEAARNAVHMQKDLSVEDHYFPLYFLLLLKLLKRQGEAINLSDIPKMFERKYGYKLELRGKPHLRKNSVFF